MGGLTTRQLASKRLRNPKQQGDRLPPGEMLQNRYQIMGTLGVGGFSSVYQARDMRFPTVTKLCAVKEMVNMAADPQMRDLTISVFEREANILATLDHPSIPIVMTISPRVTAATWSWSSSAARTWKRWSANRRKFQGR